MEQDLEDNNELSVYDDNPLSHCFRGNWKNKKNTISSH